MESVPYHEAPVWAPPDKGRPVARPVDGWKQRRALADYRERFAERSIRIQNNTLILSPLGTFWRMGNLAQFDESREQMHAVANIHRFLVIEGAHLWNSIESVMQSHD